MAYAYNPALTDEENKKKEQESLGAGGGIIGSGAGAAPISAGAQPGAAGSSASGSFTNLQRYLDENKAGSLDLGQKVAGQVTAAGEEAKSTSEGLVKTAGEQIEAARVPTTGVVEEAAINPVQVTSDAAKKAEFLKQRDAAYGGPAGLEDVEGFETAQSKLKAFQDKSAMTGNEAGRIELLRSLSPAGSGRGKLTLNQLLLSGNPEAGALVEGAGKPYENLQGYLTAESDAARTRAMNARTEADTTRQGIQDRFLGEGGVIPSFETDVTGRSATAIQEANARLARQKRGTELGLMTSGDLEGLPTGGQGYGTADDLHKAVLYANFINSLYGTNIDPSSFFKQTGSPDAAINPQNVATAEDYAKYGALAELMGQSPDFLNPAGAANAGKAPTDFADLDFQGLRGVKDTLRQRDQELFDRYGTTIEQDGRLSIRGDITDGGQGNYTQTVDQLKAIARRGVGNLPADFNQDLPMDEATIERILNGGMARPTPNPPPEQENGGAPPEAIIEVPPPPPNTPPPPETPANPPNSLGEAFYGFLGDNSTGQAAKLYINAQGQITGQDGTVQYNQSYVRDPQTGYVYNAEHAPEHLKPPPPPPPAPPPPHPGGFSYYGWLANGTPLYSKKDQYGRDVPIYYDGTEVQAFGINRDPVTGQVYLLGAV